MIQTIQLSAMTLRTDAVFEGYAVDLPEDWRKTIISLECQLTKKKKENLKSIKTKNLSRCIMASLSDIACVSPIKVKIPVCDWILSLKEIDCNKLCSAVKSWIAVRYGNIITPDIMSLFFPDKLIAGCHRFSFCMSDSKDQINKYAFSVVPLYIAKKMMAEPVKIDGVPLKFFLGGEYADRSGKVLISEPVLKDEKWFSITVSIYLHTLPPDANYVVYLHTHTRRYVSANSKDKSIYHANNINALVRTDNGSFVIPIECRKIKDNEWKDFWEEEAKACHDMFFTDTLPEASDVTMYPDRFIETGSNPRILLPFREGMGGETYEGTGIPAPNKKDVLTTAEIRCADFTERVPLISQDKFIHASRARNFKKNDEDVRASAEERRKRLAACIGQDHITFEIFGTEENSSLINRIGSTIQKLLGNSEDFKVNILINKKSAGELTALMENDSEDEFQNRILKIGKMYDTASDIRGAFIILPDYRNKPVKGDPQKAIRIGMALIHRLTQFITPDTAGELKKAEAKEGCFEGKIYGAVLDMLRQFGYTDYLGSRNCVDKLQDTTVIGLYLHKFEYRFKKDYYKFVPVILMYNMKSGKIFIKCDLFKEMCPFGDEISYPQALIHFAETYWNGLLEKYDYDAEKRRHNGIMDNLFEMLSGIKEEKVLITAHSNDGSLRNEWVGLQNKVISTYNYIELYVPERIEFGSSQYPKKVSFIGNSFKTSVRIISCRTSTGGETPDWYCFDDEDEFQSRSGIFKFNDVYMCLEGRPFVGEYLDAISKSRMTGEKALNFDTCNLVEMFPLQLQPGDNPLDWIRFNHVLREVVPENQLHDFTRLPAPLHFAKLMSEYLPKK